MDKKDIKIMFWELADAIDYLAWQIDKIEDSSDRELKRLCNRMNDIKDEITETKLNWRYGRDS